MVFFPRRHHTRSSTVDRAGGSGRLGFPAFAVLFENTFADLLPIYLPAILQAAAQLSSSCPARKSTFSLVWRPRCLLIPLSQNDTNRKKAPLQRYASRPSREISPSCWCQTAYDRPVYRVPPCLILARILGAPKSRLVICLGQAASSNQPPVC